MPKHLLLALMLALCLCGTAQAQTVIDPETEINARTVSAGSGIAIVNTTSGVQVSLDRIHGEMYSQFDDDAHADAISLTVGTYVSGTVANTATYDGTYYLLQEVNGTPGFRVDLIFNSVTGTPVHAIGHLRYEGSAGHNIKVYAFNYNTTSWDAITAASDDVPATAAIVEYEYDFPGALPGVFPDNYKSGDQMQIRFEHVTAGANTHFLYIDSLNIIQSVLDFTTANVKYPLTDLINGVSRGVTVNETDGRFTIVTPGRYLVQGSMSMDGTPLTTFTGAIAVNGFTNNHGKFVITTDATSEKYEAASLTSVLTLQASDYVSVLMWSNAGSTWLDIAESVLTIDYMGPQ